MLTSFLQFTLFRVRYNRVNFWLFVQENTIEINWISLDGVDEWGKSVEGW